MQGGGGAKGVAKSTMFYTVNKMDIKQLDVNVYVWPCLFVSCRSCFSKSARRIFCSLSFLDFSEVVDAVVVHLEETVGCV